ncbi:hypothetical protein B0T14DRAFT_282520 [Immersiella caudata]|uniref:Uncharacterized protein n=1 Tax=Immersiella caudata TaxID=314043 RepID=A0AA39WDY6_9PEZI|nr:hypothetical protein B0T14DRAFT_282520 [Immersiella caudata]
MPCPVYPHPSTYPAIHIHIIIKPHPGSMPHPSFGCCWLPKGYLIRSLFTWKKGKTNVVKRKNGFYRHSRKGGVMSWSK